jgi:hypothetical protein
MRQESSDPEARLAAFLRHFVCHGRLPLPHLALSSRPWFYKYSFAALVSLAVKLFCSFVFFATLAVKLYLFLRGFATLAVKLCRSVKFPA